MAVSVGSSRLHRLSIFVVLVVVSGGQSYAQTTGQNAVYTSGGVPAPSPSFLDAKEFGGADPCAQISNAFLTLPSSGGTVDARGLTPGTCSVNPIPSTLKGRLLLGAGTYLARVPWVIQNDETSIVGIGTGDSNGTSTAIQACASGQTGCGGVVFPSGQAVIQMGTTTGNIIQRSTVKELTVDCQDVPGVSGFQAIKAQEETVFDLVKAMGCRVAGFDLGIGDTGIQNGAALSNFEVAYPSGQGCPAVTAATYNASRSSSGLVTASQTLGPPLQPWRPGTKSSSLAARTQASTAPTG